MFDWHKEMDRLAIPVQRVRRLYRSLGDVQVALPGHPVQQTTAYVCAFTEDKGFRVAVALHLHASEKIAFYLNSKANLGTEEVKKVFEEGVYFAETMGFMLGDLDLHRLDANEKAALWDSLPLKGMDEKPKPSPAAPSTVPKFPVAATAAKVAQPKEEAKLGDIDLAEEDWADLSSLRTRHFQKRTPPTPQELQEAKSRFLQNLGRLLSSF